MNWASSHLVKRKVFQGAPVQYGWLLQAEAGWDKKVIIKRKEGIDSVKVTFMWETDSKGFTDYLINVGQEIPGWLLKIPLQTGVETAFQSEFVVLGASDSTLSLWFLFFLYFNTASLAAQLVNKLPAMQETLV